MLQRISRGDCIVCAMGLELGVTTGAKQEDAESWLIMVRCCRRLPPLLLFFIVTTAGVTKSHSLWTFSLPQTPRHRHRVRAFRDYDGKHAAPLNMSRYLCTLGSKHWAMSRYFYLECGVVWYCK